MTQHPLVATIKDFWQMVWDHNVQTIVLLSSLDDMVSINQPSNNKISLKLHLNIISHFISQSFPQFWPDDSLPIESDHYRVKFVSKTNKNDYVGRDFVMQSIQDDYELNVRMLHCPSWPEMANPSSIYDFIVDVHHRGNEYRNGPIVVVDRYVLWMVCLGSTKAKKLH